MPKTLWIERTWDWLSDSDPREGLAPEAAKGWTEENFTDEQITKMLKRGFTWYKGTVERVADRHYTDLAPETCPYCGGTYSRCYGAITRHINACARKHGH